MPQDSEQLVPLVHKAKLEIQVELQELQAPWEQADPSVQQVNEDSVVAQVPLVYLDQLVILEVLLVLQDHKVTLVPQAH